MSAKYGRFVVPFLTIIAGGTLNGLVQTIGETWPHAEHTAAGVVSIIAICAGIILGTIKCANAPASSVVENAPIVTPGGNPTGALNVTTSSTEPIVAPQAQKEP